MAELMNIKTSAFGGISRRLKITNQYVEVISPHEGLSGRTRSQRVRYQNIAQVVTLNHFIFTSIVIETNGGHSLQVDGLTRKQARDVLALIEAGQEGVKATPDTGVEELE